MWSEVPETQVPSVVDCGIQATGLPIWATEAIDEDVCVLA